MSSNKHYKQRITKKIKLIKTEQYRFGNDIVIGRHESDVVTSFPSYDVEFSDNDNRYYGKITHVKERKIEECICSLNQNHEVVFNDWSDNFKKDEDNVTAKNTCVIN